MNVLHALITFSQLSSPLYASVIQSSTLYTIKDLEVLERERNFDEFFLHANDIRPSERKKLWIEMYQTMAAAKIDQNIKTQDYSLEAYQAIEKIARNSALANDELFQAKRAQYAKSFFKQCYQRAIPGTEAFKSCDNELNAFWYYSKKDAELALGLVQIIDQYPTELNHWSFYQLAVRDSVAPIYCQDPKLQKAIFKKMTEETFKNNFNGDYQSLVKKTVSEGCFKALIPNLKLTLTSTKASGLDKELAMNILESKKLLNEEEQDLFALSYLLDGPVVGEKMNLAWKTVESLSESFPKRTKLLEKVKNLPVIPDKIFKDPDLPRHKAIVKLITKNFPEFLNYYGQTCLTFIKQKSETTVNLSSSEQCHKFLNAATKETWVSDSITSEYSSLKK